MAGGTRLPWGLGRAFRSGRNTKDTVSNDLTLSSPLSFISSRVHTEELSERRREGYRWGWGGGERRDGANVKMGDGLFIRATTHPKTSGSPGFNNPPKLPLFPSLPRGMREGDGEGGRFLYQEAVPHCRSKAETIMVTAQLLGRHSDTDSPERRGFLLPASFSYVHSHVPKSGRPPDTWPPARARGTAWLCAQGSNHHGLCLRPQCSAELWTARGRNTTADRRTRTRTRPSLVPPCTEILKSRLVLTLHIMSIVSKEKRFMELKHPQE